MSFLDLLFPKNCLECGTSGKYICDNCLQKVPAGGWSKGNYSMFRYDGVIRKAIIALKYKFATQVADELEQILTLRMKNIDLRFKGQILVPIPLHRLRRNWRGFNQSEMIGEKLAKNLGWYFYPDLLIRSKKTTPQVELKGIDRRQNLRGVFAVAPNHTLITNLYSLVVFDDVATTGSTIFEAKKALENAGFTKIWGLTIAR